MAIKDWACAARPREKLLEHGPAALTDAELLAILLRTGVRGRSAVDLGAALLARFGGLRGLMAADTAVLEEPGVGPAKAVALRAALELARRHLNEALARGAALESPAAARDYLLMQLRDRAREVFAALFLDNKHRVLAFEELFQGTVNGAAVYPREVARRCLEHNAAALIVAHNHPSGDPEPSAADRALTDRLREALALVDVRLLDHFVIGAGRVVSFSERGWL